MKKTLRFLLVASAVAVLFSACKSHEKCPAYGSKTEKQPTSVRG